MIEFQLTLEQQVTDSTTIVLIIFVILFGNKKYDSIHVHMQRRMSLAYWHSRSENEA